MKVKEALYNVLFGPDRSAQASTSASSSSSSSSIPSSIVAAAATLGVSPASLTNLTSHSIHSLLNLKSSNHGRTPNHVLPLFLRIVEPPSFCHSLEDVTANSTSFSLNALLDYDRTAETQRFQAGDSNLPIETLNIQLVEKRTKKPASRSTLTKLSSYVNFHLFSRRTNWSLRPSLCF